MPEFPIDFQAFDPEAELEISHGHLPHWFQPGVVTFITFRLNDAMPKDVLDLWRKQLRDWLARHSIAVSEFDPLPTWEKVPNELQTSYRKYRERVFHEYLDQGHGACHLRNRRFAEIVVDSLLHFDGKRYELDCAVVMPNHVHLLAMFHSPTTCRDQCTSWTHFTATKINSILGRNGELWQTEPFDHLVRSAEQFNYLRTYIAQNGPSAKLPSTDYLYLKNY